MQKEGKHVLCVSLVNPGSGGVGKHFSVQPTMFCQYTRKTRFYKLYFFEIQYNSKTLCLLRTSEINIRFYEETA